MSPTPKNLSWPFCYLHRVLAAGKLADVNLGIQMLKLVHDAADHTVSVLVGSILSDPLRNLLKDLKEFKKGKTPALEP
jgi:hypothetical protein